MAGICPTEGLEEITLEIINNSTINRGTNLVLGLFLDTSISDATTYASLTKPTGGNYQEISLVDANWTGSSGVKTYTKQAFTAIGSAYSGLIYGYYIATTGTSYRLLAIELDPNGGQQILENGTYNVTPTIDFTS
jgi:hypothetical protein